MALLTFDARFRHASGFEIDAAFEVGDGVTALFGPSGSGKSTILHLIAGLLRPSDGSIRLGARVLVDTKAGICLRPEQRRVGMVFQDHLLFPHLSVRRNLMFGMNRDGGPRMNFDRVVNTLALGDVLDRTPATLSGGQAQRVAVGRALLRGPELLLLDEPLAGLDQKLKERSLSFLKETVLELGIPTLFVGHERNDVDRIADSVVAIEMGRSVKSDTDSRK